MKTNRIILNACLIIAASALMLTGCKKEEEDTNTSNSSDNAFAESTFNDVTNISDEAGTSGSLSNYRTGPAAEDGILTSCATITFDSVNGSDQDTININFGPTNCVGNDGRNRRGEIVVYYTGGYRDVGSVHTVTFNNYYVNDHQVLGTKTVTNLGPNSAGHLVYSIDVNGQIILANNAGTITWVSQRQREWLQGESTPLWSDDVYSITGSASGTGSDGHTFSANITSALIRNMSIGCRRHFVQGTIELTPDNRPMRTIDFGTGACDDVATVTINNHTYTIHLR